MPTVVLSPIGGSGEQFFNNNGTVLSGGKIYTYAAGTTTPLTTYTSLAGTVANANPVVLNSAGRVSGQIWLIYGASYKFVIKDSLGNTIDTQDNISGSSAAGGLVTAATIVALKAMTGMTTGTRVLVQDLGFYRYDSSSSTTALGSLVVTPDSGAGRWFIEVDGEEWRPYFNVKQYGAVGDGATDDTAAIQAAVTAAITVSGEVFFPVGTYLVSASIIMGSSATGVTLTGVNCYSSIIQYTATSGSCFDCSGATGQRRNYIFRDLKIYGSASTVGFTGHGINYSGASGNVELRVERCYITGFNTDNATPHVASGIYMANTYSNSIRDCIIIANSVGVVVGATSAGQQDIAISGGRIIQNGHSGIYSGGVQSMTIDRVDLEGQPRGVFFSGTANSRNVAISNCYLEALTADAVTLNLCRTSVVRDCYFSGACTPTNALIYVEGSSDIRIQSIDYFNVTGSTPTVLFVGPGCSRVAVDDSIPPSRRTIQSNGGSTGISFVVKRMAHPSFFPGVPENLIAWAPDNAGASLATGQTIAATSAVTDPLGGTNAYLLDGSAEASESGSYRIQNVSRAIAAGERVAFSFWARKVAGDSSSLGTLLQYRTTADGVIHSELANYSFNITEDWTYIETSFVTTADIDLINPLIYPAGTSAKGKIYLFGLNVRAGEGKVPIYTPKDATFSQTTITTAAQNPAGVSFGYTATISGEGAPTFNAAAGTIYVDRSTGTPYIRNVSSTGTYAWVVTGASLSGSATWNPGNLVDGAGETSASITVTGAALGDFAICSAPYDLQGITCSAYVDATNSAKIRLQNETGGAIDLASGTWRVRVIRQ